MIALPDNSIKTSPIVESVYALAPSPRFALDGVCFAAGDGGLWRTEDRGSTWQFALRSLGLAEPLRTTSVVVSPHFAQDRTVFAGAPGGLLRSLDGGETWIVTALPTPPPAITALAISPCYAGDGVVVAATMEDGIFRSGNGGRRWEPRNFGLLDLSVLALAVSPGFERDETIYVGTESGLFQSTNGGHSWREVGFPSDLAPVSCLALSPGFVEDGVIFVGTDRHGLYRSSDRGASWQRLGEDRIVDVVNGIVLAPDFAARPRLLALTPGPLLSYDGGATWAMLVDAPDRQDLLAVAAPSGLEPGAPLLASLASGGVVRLSVEI